MSKSTFLAFTVGALIGAAGAWYYAKQRYERIAQEEIDSVKEAYGKRYESDQTEENPVAVEEKPERVRNDVIRYASILNDQGYTSYGMKKAEKDLKDKPYVISPDEFGEYDDYTKISLMFYADQVLADEMDQPVDNIEEIIGFDSLTHFGEYEDDSVFVRNDARKCDYEILKSLRKYSEVLSEKPYKAEV